MLNIYKFFKKFLLIFCGLNEESDILFEDDENENENSKDIDNKKKIFFILLFLVILFGGSFLFYNFFFNDIDSLNYLLKELSKYIDENTYLKIEKIIDEMLKYPEKKQKGIYLLEIIKFCKGIDSKTVISDDIKFEFYLSKIIEKLYK